MSQETISTCRFSQRVALIKNEVRVNEELDPKLVSRSIKREVTMMSFSLCRGQMVRQLRQQVAELREELSLATGGEERDGDLELAERERWGPIYSRSVQNTVIWRPKDFTLFPLFPLRVVVLSKLVCCSRTLLGVQY